jgi:hypothetical protein
MFHIPCINWYNVYQEPEKCTSNSTDVFLLWHFYLQVWAGNPTISTVTFLLQEYSVIRCVKLLHSIEIPMIIG